MMGMCCLTVVWRDLRRGSLHWHCIRILPLIFLFINIHLYKINLTFTFCLHIYSPWLYPFQFCVDSFVYGTQILWFLQKYTNSHWSRRTIPNYVVLEVQNCFYFTLEQTPLRSRQHRYCFNHAPFVYNQNQFINWCLLRPYNSPSSYLCRHVEDSSTERKSESVAVDLIHKY